MPVLTVGLPVYNGAKWIEDALESILEQSLRDFDLVISDNASTDDTEAICRSAATADARVRYHRNPRNIGIYSNFNRVFDLSSGKYFKWASSLRQTALHRPMNMSDFSLMAELSLRGKFVEIPDRLLLRRRDPEASAMLTGAALPAAQAQGYPRPLDTLQRFNLHTYRFVTTFRAPIDFAEKLRVWYFLLWRLTWRHRHQAFRKLFRIVTRGR